MARSPGSTAKSVMTARQPGRRANGRSDPSRVVAADPVESRVRLAIAISRLYGAAVRGFNAAAKDSGASFEQWLVLSEVARREAVTMGELARALGINLSTLTRIVDRMVSASLLYRNIDPQDRRRVVLVVSDAGGQLLVDLQVRLAEGLVSAVSLHELLDSGIPDGLQSLIDALESGA